MATTQTNGRKRTPKRAERISQRKPSPFDPSVSPLAAMQRKGMTTHDLAKATGYCEAYIRRGLFCKERANFLWAAGIKPTPKNWRMQDQVTFDAGRRIAQALGTTDDMFYTRPASGQCAHSRETGKSPSSGAGLQSPHRNDSMANAKGQATK